MIYKANEYQSELRSTWIADPADATLAVTSIPTNLPTLITTGAGTASEKKFSVTGVSGDSPSNYQLTGVTLVSGTTENVSAGTSVKCINHEEYFNQYSEIVNEDYLRLVDLDESPATPDEGKTLFYLKDGQAFTKDDEGNETVITTDIATQANSSMYRQAIINGNFDVNQRGFTGTPIDGTKVYVSDKWFDYVKKDGGTLPTLTRSIVAETPGTFSATFYLSRLTTNGAGTSLGVNSYGAYEQFIEHGVRYLCGLNKTVTVSFWARSNIANKRICPVLAQNYGTGGSPSTTERIKGTPITLTSLWTKYTATFTTNTLTGKTFGTNNDDLLGLEIAYMWGTTAGNTNVQTSVTAETFVGSGYIDIARVLLCAGSVALPFQPVSFHEEKTRCMRFYEKSFQYNEIPANGSTTTTLASSGSATYAPSTNYGYTSIPYKVDKCKLPTLTLYGNSNGKILYYSAQGVLSADTGGAIQSSSTNNFWLIQGIVNNTYIGMAFHWTAEADVQ